MEEWYETERDRLESGAGCRRGGQRKDGVMLIVVDPHSGVPVYRQLMDQVKFHVASGLLRAGDELPATRYARETWEP